MGNPIEPENFLVTPVSLDGFKSIRTVSLKAGKWFSKRELLYIACFLFLQSFCIPLVSGLYKRYFPKVSIITGLISI